MKFLNKGQTVTCSMRTAFMMISFTLSSDGLCIKCLNMRQAKSQCKPWEEVSEYYFRNTDLKEHRVSGIIFAMLLQTTFCLTRRHHKQVLPVQEPSNYFRGSKMLSSFIHFCNIHSDTCLHTLVSFSLPVSKYTPILKYKLQLSIITLSYCGTLPS